MFQSQQQTGSGNSNSFVNQQSGQQQQQQQSQLSPNRSGQMGLGSGNIVGGGPMNRRMYQNPSNLPRGGSGFGSTTSSMGSFIQQASRYGSQGFQSVFGSSDATPTFLDLNEFPSLTNARGSDQHSNVLPGSKPYGEYFDYFCFTSKI
jgi:hypothetical protein